MPPLAYGLTLHSKSRPPQGRTVAPAKSKGVFDDESGTDDDDDVGAGNGSGIANPPNDGLVDLESIQVLDSAPPTTALPALVRHTSSEEAVSSLQANSKYRNLSSQHAAAAQTLDPTSYDYDGVYDSLHASRATRVAGSGPKYMQQLLKAAEVRKRDQLRAKDTILLRERESEGQEFADKEQFVTTAYKAQQEEVRRLEGEEEEREKADAERKRREGGGMTSFYRGLMERDEANHQAEITEVALNDGNRQQNPRSAPKSEAELARESGVAVNDDGLIVDKRQTLRPGLNLKAKPSSSSPQPTIKASLGPSASMAVLSGQRSSRVSMRERQSRMLEAQLEAAAKRAADELEVAEEAVQRSAKSQKTAADVLSARERYLQRKREAASTQQ